MRCHYCHYEEKSHDSACPKQHQGLTEKQSRARMAAWQLGYRAGRSGSDVKSPRAFIVGKGLLPATWQLGEIRGNVALEEAENGYDYRDYG